MGILRNRWSPPHGKRLETVTLELGVLYNHKVSLGQVW